MKYQKRFVIGLICLFSHLSLVQAATDCTVTEIPHECEALVEFYNSTDGDNWKRNWRRKDNWNVTNEPCGWYGISCGGYSGINIISLHLPGNQLSGTIPDSLGNLSRLTELYLSDNRLSGTIPDSLGNLSRLTVLELGSNQLTGIIPPELGKLRNLTDLSLSINQLTGTIPPELGNLSNLTNFSLGGNQLTGIIPPELGKLRNLTDLSLNINQLTGTIPPELGNLSNLTDLSLVDNQLIGTIPPELKNLNNLSYISLYCNLLTIPSDQSLIDFIDARINPYSGAPDDWKNTQDGNCFSSSTPPLLPFLIPNSLCATVIEIPPVECEALVALYNSTDGPNWKDSATNNWNVTKTPCNWSGVFCSELGNPKNLVGLWLKDNQLIGIIPSELGNLSNLTDIDLSDNQLIEAIPSELGNLNHLVFLNLGFNQLTGTIPSELGNLNNLTDLWLENNQLTGTIPPELGNLSNLTYLDLSYNQLTGTISPRWGNLSNLTGLWLNNNQLTGTIPSELGNLSKLSVIALTCNLLTIPSDQNFLNFIDTRSDNNWKNTQEGSCFSSNSSISADQCTTKGNIWVDNECKLLPITTGLNGPTVINPYGTSEASDAKFSGGWSENGEPYKSTVTYDGGEVTITQIIRFDPAHVGKDVDIFILLNLHLSPPSGPQLWYQVSSTSGFIAWDEFPATIEAFETHTIVANESKVIGPYNLGVLKDFPASDIKFKFGYRINNSTIITTGIPTTLEVRSSSSDRYTDNGNGTVTDNRSGLIWLKDANCFGQQDWETAMQSAANLANGQCSLSDSSTSGVWRLPTKDEWEAMIDTSYEEPVLSNAAGTGKWTEGDAFSGVMNDYWSAYWSATTFKANTSTAWIISLDKGIVPFTAKDDTCYVWLVRGGV